MCYKLIFYGIIKEVIILKRNYFIIFIIAFIIFCCTASIFAFKLELGDRVEEVKIIQKYLYNLGYDVDIDGIYGYQTKEIVRDFQYSNGLTVDGIVGNLTLEKLKEINEEIKYIVKKGDNLSQIAKRYNTNVKNIMRFNNLNSELIKIGQELKIPKDGIGGGEDEKIYAPIFHEIQPGDALSLISKKYGVDIETIKLANNLHSDFIRAGDTIVIPHLQRASNQPFKLEKGAFIWPVLGRISSGYGYRIHPIRKERHFHGGIDIAIPFGSKIRAAAAGTVIQSGYINGFGKTIVIDHGNGIRTLYAHNSSLLVRAGTKVNLGQTIALSGSTGTSTGPHLDFRIYYNGNTVNPFNYLP